MTRYDSTGNIEVYGSEKDILVELSEKLNFKATFKIDGEFPGFVFENGTATGPLGKVINGECDVAIGYISLQYLRTLFFSETKAYTIIPLVMIVPPGEEYGEIGKFAQPFTIEVWISLYVVIVIALMVIFVVSRSPKTVHNFVIGRKVTNPIFNLLSIGYGMSQNRLPTRNFARFILMSYILYWIILRSAYTGGIYKILESSSKPAVASIDEMLDNNFKFYFYETLDPRMKSFKFYDRRVVFPNTAIQEYRMKTLNPSFKGVVFNSLDQILYQNMVNYRNFTFRICKQPFLTNLIVFYFRKNHYLVEEVNTRIDSMLSNGMIQKIRESYSDPKFLEPSKEVTEHKTLTIDNFDGVFFLFGLWCTFAISIFALEMITYIKRLRFLKKVMDYVQYRDSN